MPETKRMAEEAKRMGQEAQEQAKRVGQEFQRAAERGFEAASRSFAEINRNFQAIATEMNDFSKRRFDDVLQSWEQLLRARSFPAVVEVQTRYAEKAYDAYMSDFPNSERCISARPAKPLRRPKKLREGSASGSFLCRGLKLQIVEQARALIADEQHWCPGDLARDVNGEEVCPTAASAVKRCGLGAVIAAAYQLTNDLDATHDLAFKALRPSYGTPHWSASTT